MLEEINKISSFADDTIIFYTSETELYQKPKVNLLDYKKNERNKINKKMEEKNIFLSINSNHYVVIKICYYMLITSKLFLFLFLFL